MLHRGGQWGNKQESNMERKPVYSFINGKIVKQDKKYRFKRILLNIIIGIAVFLLVICMFAIQIYLSHHHR